MKTIQADVAIVGGGIIGAATALFLQQKGKHAVVLERGMLAFEASGRNGGGVRQQGRLLPEIPFARGAVELWGRLDSLLGRPTGYRRVGNLFVAEDEADLEMLAAERQRELAAGLETELLDTEQVRELAPGLAPHVVGGKLCPTDGYAIPAQASVAIAEAAREAGAEFYCHNPVGHVGLSGDRVAYVQSSEVRVEAPQVLNTAGPWAPYVSQLVDVYLPIFPSRTYNVTTPPVEYITGPVVIAAKWNGSATQWPDGRVQLGGGPTRNEPQRFTFRKVIAPEQVESIRERAGSLFPALKGVPIEHTWAGIREYTPDVMPILGPLD